jgi:hypothetical protein
MAGTKKVKVLADSFRVWNFDEDRRVIESRGYRDYGPGDVVELPDWVADDALRQGTQSPNGSYRPVAILADQNEEDHVVAGYRDDVSAFPEGDFGTTTVAGNLVADPQNKLQKQRDDARKAELSPQRKPTQTQSDKR